MNLILKDKEATTLAKTIGGEDGALVSAAYHGYSFSGRELSFEDHLAVGEFIRKEILEMDRENGGLGFEGELPAAVKPASSRASR